MYPLVPLSVASPVVTDDGVCFAGTNTGVHVIDSETGDRVRRYDVKAKALSPGQSALYAVRWANSTPLRIA